jgi:hypothetical protein
MPTTFMNLKSQLIAPQNQIHFAGRTLLSIEKFDKPLPNVFGMVHQSQRLEKLVAACGEVSVESRRIRSNLNL